MKTKISHLGRSTVSVILAVMMLLSTMLIGTVSTVNATTTPLEEGTVVYVQVKGGGVDWYADTNNAFSAWVWGGKATKQWVQLKSVPSTDNKYFYFVVPEGGITSCLLHRKSNTMKDGWIVQTNYWNATGDITLSNTNNLITIKDWNNSFSNDSCYQTDSTAKLVADNTTVTEGTAVTFTPSLTSNTDFNDIKSVSYSVKKDSVDASSSDYSIDDNKITFKKAGNYEVTANVMYNAKGFSNITKTTTATTTITVESSQTPVAESVTLTALPETVTSGGSTKLTATLTNKATGVDKVTYTFKKADGTVVSTVTDSAENTASFNVENITSDTTYTVTVSADNYKSITSNEATVTVEAKKTFYLFNSKNNDIATWPDGNGIEMKLVGGKYVAQLDLEYSDFGTNCYFAINDSPNKPTKDSQLWHGKSEYSITKNAKNVERAEPQDYNQVYYFYFAYYKLNSVTIEFDGENNVTITDGGSTAETVKITVPTVENAKVTAVANTTTYNEGESFDIKVGSSFTVNVEGENGYTLKKITYGKQSKTETGAEFTAESGEETFNVEMVHTVSNPVTVTFGSNDGAYGTVSAMNGTTSLNSPAKVNVGDDVTFTATPKKGYAFESWTVNGVSASSTANPYKITVDKDTTVVANFKVEDSGTIAENMHFLYGTSDKPNELQETQEYKVYEKDRKYIVTLKEKDYKQLFFAFSTTNEYKNMVPNNGLIVKADNPEGLDLVEARFQQFYLDTNYLYGKMSIIGEHSEEIGEIKIIYDPEAKTYTVKATKDSASDTTVNIVGKDGTVRKDYYGKTTSALGDTTLKVTSPDGTTTITAIDSCNFDGHSQGVTAKKVPYGSKVTVTTTINPKATFAGHSGSEYYVKGFSINGFTGGVLTQKEGSSHEGDVYEYTFTVKEDVYAAASTIEITPIYFLKNDSNCVTFYVENFMDAKDKWGDTIACYAYYSNGDALGGYPGQPMVNAEGSIYMQIPKHIGADATNVVKGITLNNYVWDFVHVSGDDTTRESKNCQTYDYDDFKYLANMSKVNSSDSAADIKNIVYRFKYHTYNNSSAEAGNVPKGKLPETTVDITKYEVFVDYYDKPTDIFGTIIKGNDAVTVDTVKAESEYLTIVSDGYVNYYNETKNYLGQYATKWYIYNKEGQQVAALPPSALLYGLTKPSSELETLVKQEAVPTDFMSDSGASKEVISGYWASFKLLYTKYADKYAIINYESSIHSSGRDDAIKQPGERCDGRWYYSVDRAKITGDIRIEYADTLDSFTTMKGVNTDTFIKGTATGKNTAAEAYFTSPAGQSTTDKPTHVETTSDNSENFKFTVGATSSTSYTFVGWYRLIDDTYKAVNDPSELNKTTGQVARNANVVLVARYIKTPGGSMTFNHSLYTGKNAGGGKATTEIQVVVKSSDGIKEYYNSGRIDSTASIDKKTISEILTDQQGAKITVTLYTTTKNLYNFNGYYSAENTTDITAFPPSTADFTKTVSGDRKNGRVTESVYTFSFNEYYNRYAGILTAPDAGTVYYNFYSDITSIKVPYKVQFSYKDRMEKQKYYNRAGYVDPENTSSYTIVEDGNDVKVTLTDRFILTLAPYESNFAKDLTWNKTPDSNTPFDSSNSKSIASAVVKSTQSDKKIHLNVFCDGKGDPTPRTNTVGTFELFKRNNSAELPYGSVFYTKKDDGTYKYDIIAPKTYEGKQFMYWAIYSDEDCNNLVINAYNSDRAFSYVAYDNCWIAPVYGESSTPSASVKEVSTTTQFMEVTRNQWTAENAESFTTGLDVDTMTKLDDFIKEKGEDKLYADFVLNFFYNGKQLSVFDPNSDKVKAGVLIQRLELDGNKNGPGYITDLNHYANKYTPKELADAEKDAIDKITTGNSVIPSVKQQINNSRLDNKNRLQYYTRFNNVVDNSDCVFRLYTYIQYTGADGEPVVQLSDPVYFTFYDIANKS